MIDNSIAERAQRAVALDRKNILFLRSDKGVKDLVTFHSFRATCAMLKTSFGSYLKKVLDLYNQGRTDWQNMTPAALLG